MREINRTFWTERIMYANTGNYEAAVCVGGNKSWIILLKYKVQVFREARDYIRKVIKAGLWKSFSIILLNSTFHMGKTDYQKLLSYTSVSIHILYVYIVNTVSSFEMYKSLAKRKWRHSYWAIWQITQKSSHYKYLDMLDKV